MEQQHRSCASCGAYISDAAALPMPPWKQSEEDRIESQATEVQRPTESETSPGPPREPGARRARQGWYEFPDTTGRGVFWRYWDGYGWTLDIEGERPPEVVGAGVPPETPPGAELSPSGATGHGEALASWGYRVGGFLVDGGLAVAIGLGVGLIANALGADQDTEYALGGICSVVAWIAVTSVASAITGGQSVGKALGGMRVVGNAGQRYGFFRSLLRDTVCRLIYLVPLVFIIDSLFPLGPERRSLRDRMVGASVLQEPVYKSRALILTVAAIVTTGAYVGLAAASGGFADGDYTEADRTAFIEGCTSGGVSEAGCGCVFDYVRNRVSYEDYQAADSTDRREDWPPGVSKTVSKGFGACGE